MTDWLLEDEDHWKTDTVVDARCSTGGGACGDNPWLSIPSADYEGHMGSPAPVLAPDPTPAAGSRPSGPRAIMLRIFEDAEF